MAAAHRSFDGDPLWYKDAVVYELHVRSFFDSTGDGIGDFPGLTRKLDYLQELGVTALWLLPFYPSPLRDDGYDIAGYRGVHPAYGTLRDFRTFLEAAHRRGLRVITELVLNHTSDRHPWFQRARQAPPGSRWRNFYVWSDRPDRYADAPVIFRDFEASNWTWDSTAQAYYWHRFFSHQPDLNFQSADVRRALVRAMGFWLRMGVDGMRLDAVPYLYERDGTSCENLPETHSFLKSLRHEMDQHFPGRMLLAEANLWPEAAAAYFGDGDECHMAFNFPLMPRLFMALRMEDRFPIVDIFRQVPSIPQTCQWAVFLRNHDELTLATVTDEERDYMYRVYAQDADARVNLGIRRRLAPLLGNHRRAIELMTGLLFSLPGTPVLYYGDEIGMGDNVYLGDRNAVRTPMQWSADRNAGFSRANPQRLSLPVIVDPEYHYEAVNVEAQQDNLHSLSWWIRRLIGLRKRFAAFGRGGIQFLQPDNPKVLAFLREYRGERVLVVANLSRFSQPADLDLSALKDMTPVEAFGRTPFPPIGEGPYRLTLGPHSFYWFSLVPQRVEASLPAEVGGRVPSLSVHGPLAGLFEGQGRAALEALLPSYLKRRHWFVGAGRTIQGVRVLDAVPVDRGQPEAAYLCLLHVDYTEGESERYVLTLGAAFGDRAQQLLGELPQQVVAHLRIATDDRAAILFDAFWDPAVCRHLLQAIAGAHRLDGRAGHLFGYPNRPAAFRDRSLDPIVLKGEHNSALINYGDRFLLKIFRRVEEGVNSELELGLFLNAPGDGSALGDARAPVPPVLGSLEYRSLQGTPTTVGVVQQFVPNRGTAWHHTLDELARYFERALARKSSTPPPLPLQGTVALAAEEIPGDAAAIIGPYLELARLLGGRTADLHRTLASQQQDPRLAPEPISLTGQQSLYQSMRGLAVRVFQSLRPRSAALPAPARALAGEVLPAESDVLLRFRPLLEQRVQGTRIRIHGDYHLRQVLLTEHDFVVLDLEGQSARPSSEQRLKRPALQDVASMLCSFHRAAYVAMEESAAMIHHPGSDSGLDPWGRFWHRWVSVAFLKGYLTAASEEPFLPQDPAQIQLMLDIHLLERVLAEVAHELERDPKQVHLPLGMLLELLAQPHLST